MIYSVGQYRIDDRAYEVWRDSELVPVEPQVLELLLFLIEHREQVVTKEQIFEHVWKGRIVSESALSSRIKAVRKLLGDDGNRQSIIRTVYGRGFRFVAELADESSAGNIDGVGHDEASLTGSQLPDTRYAAIDGVHVAYQVFGDGPLDLVIVPGFISNVDNYWENTECAAWLQNFAKYARVVVFDKRGTGLSDRVARLPTMDERMEDVRAVMDAAGMESAALLGISEGGSLASLFAASHPERCRALVLFGSFAQFSSWVKTEEDFDAFVDYVRSDWGSGNSLPGYAPSQVGNAAFERWWGRFERLGASPSAVIDLMRMNKQIDILDVLPTIHVPTLVVHRSDDCLIDPAAGTLLSKRIPGAQLLSLPSADHIPWVGTTVNEESIAVQRFLEQAPETGAEADQVLATVVVIDASGDRFRLDSRPLERLRHQIQHHRGGPLFKLDTSWGSAFDAPGRAVRFATGVRATLPRAQVGVHTGEIRMSPSRVEGLAVNLASDIARRAAPGAVVVSRTVTDLVAGSGTRFKDLGAHDLGGVPAGWHLYEVR